MAESQINGTTASYKSDSCSDRLPHPSASPSVVCRVHGLCLVPRENVSIFKNSFGSPKCVSLLPSSSFCFFFFFSSSSSPLFILQHYFGLAYNCPPFSDGLRQFPARFLIPLHSNTLPLVSPSLMLSHSFSCCFNYCCCNFFLFLIIVWFSFLPHNQSILERSYIFCNIFPGVIYPLSPFFWSFIFLLLLWVHIFPLQTSFHIYKYAIILKIIMDMSILL